MKFGSSSVHYSGSSLALIHGGALDGRASVDTSLHLHKVHIIQDPSSCWRNCGAQEAKHFHLFWSCPSIKTLWIHSDLEEILDMQVPSNWQELFSGRLHTMNTYNETRRLYGILSLAALKSYY